MVVYFISTIDFSNSVCWCFWLLSCKCFQKDS